MLTKKVLFYSSVPTLSTFSSSSFYKIDIECLRKLGCDVTISNKWWAALLFWKYDTMFSYFWTKSIIPIFFAKIFLKRVVSTGGADNLSVEFNKSRSKYYIHSLFFRGCLGLSDTCLVSSKSDLKNMEAIVGKNSKLHLSYHPVVLPTIENVALTRKKIIFTICWMGSKGNVIRKGVDRTLMVFEKVLQIDHEFLLVIAGEMGSGTDYLQEMISEIGLDKAKVQFLNVIEDAEKYQILGEVMFYSQLSLYEGFGLAALEALATKSVVLHSGMGGLRETIENYGINVDLSLSNEKIAEIICESANNFNTDALNSTEFRTHLQQFAFETRLKDIKCALLK